MAGSLAGGLYQHRLKTLGESKAFKRDKLERFVTLLNQLHHLGLSPDRCSEIEQKRQWLEYVTEMTTITQLYLPELQLSAVGVMETSRDFAVAGQRMIAAYDDESPDPDSVKKLERSYQAKRKPSQKAWEFAMDQAQLLARRMGLHENFEPLIPEVIPNGGAPE